MVRYKVVDPSQYTKSQVAPLGQGTVFMKDITDAEFDDAVALLKRQGHEVTVVEDKPIPDRPHIA